jgi:hypothetical protein
MQESVRDRYVATAMAGHLTNHYQPITHGAKDSMSGVPLYFTEQKAVRRTRDQHVTYRTEAKCRP